ncbi:MAG: hypothetical protein IT450_08980 [Phycisphaerales bacterium]|nr:hypothetical protein [Phycisphaerales bacterium]
MSAAQIQQLLDLIDRLPDDDRVLFEKRLSERIEAEWSAAVSGNKRLAEERGITEETIDSAIHRRRYGR